MQCPQPITLPFKTIIKGGVTPGKSFTVRGIVNPDAKRIHINLRHRFGIAFHYNPRFDENRVVCNTWDGKWGAEEHPAGMPFKEGQAFEVTIYCTGHRYNVSVNGQPIHSYNHRFWEFSEIDVFEIFGNFVLTYAQI